MMRKNSLALFYFLISLAVWVFASIPLLLIAIFKKQYYFYRFFPFTNRAFKNNDIWFHSCSLGETKALAPIINSTTKDISISTITDTGFGEAKKLCSDVRYLPFEIFLPFWIKKHDKLFIMEAELWYFMVLFAKLKGAKVYLINARINTHSYHKYLRLKWFYATVFSYIDTVFAQSDDDKKRLESLGATYVKVCGNIKLASKIEINKKHKKPTGLLITSASTHDKEEELILEAYKALEYKATLLVVPRHPYRFDKVSSLVDKFCKQNGYSYHRYSKQNSFSGSDIVVVDVLGELINIYAISDVVILGGAFENIGGHNPLEPATFGCKIISGNNIFNQIPLFDLVSNVVFANRDNLAEVLNMSDNMKKSKINSTSDISQIIETINE
jgi:3-deoxy-D-manno-octulosonic-acid transferase